MRAWKAGTGDWEGLSAQTLGLLTKKRRLADRRAELPPVTSSQWERQGSPSRQRSPGSQGSQLQREAMTLRGKVA